MVVGWAGGRTPPLRICSGLHKVRAAERRPYGCVRDSIRCGRQNAAPTDMFGVTQGAGGRTPPLWIRSGVRLLNLFTYHCGGLGEVLPPPAYPRSPVPLKTRGYGKTRRAVGRLVRMCARRNSRAAPEADWRADSRSDSRRNTQARK